MLLGRCPRLTVGLVDPCGMLSPTDSGSVGPYGTLSRLTLTLLACVGRCLRLTLMACMGRCPRLTLTARVPIDSVGLYGTLSPFNSDSVGSYGTLSLSDSVAVGPVGPDGTLSSSDLAGILFPAVPTGIPFPVGPVGPYGTSSPSDTVAVGPDGTLSSSDLAGILFPAVPTGIPFP